MQLTEAVKIPVPLGVSLRMLQPGSLLEVRANHIRFPKLHSALPRVDYTYPQ